MDEMKKLTELMQCTTGTPDGKAVFEAMETLNHGVDQLLERTKAFLTGEKPPKVEVTEQKQALAELHRIGAAHSIDIPALTDDREVMMYLVTMAKEVIFGGENRD